MLSSQRVAVKTYRRRDSMLSYPRRDIQPRWGVREERRRGNRFWDWLSVVRQKRSGFQDSTGVAPAAKVPAYQVWGPEFKNLVPPKKKKKKEKRWFPAVKSIEKVLIKFHKLLMSSLFDVYS
jgi:hypothetical protein